jgi:hypothetical protein
MTVETTTPAIETTASTVAQPKAVKPIAKKAVKPVKPVAKKATKLTTKKVVKKVAKPVAKPVATRAQHTFILSSKADLADFGSGQRLAIAKLIKKGATRADLIAKLPDVKPESISWHLSMMVKNGEAKKVAAK